MRLEMQQFLHLFSLAAGAGYVERSNQVWASENMEAHCQNDTVCDAGRKLYPGPACDFACLAPQQATRTIWQFSNMRRPEEMLSHEFGIWMRQSLLQVGTQAISPVRTCVSLLSSLLDRYWRLVRPLIG